MTADPVLASVHIDAPPERVYEYFVKPQAMLAWMGDYALLETEPGGRSISTSKARQYAAATWISNRHTGWS